MSPLLPAPLQNGVARIIEGVGSKDLARRSAALSDGYRRGAISDRVIRDESDVAAYVTTRLPATYAATMSVLEAVKKRMPHFAPTTVLDVGAGPGTASWAAAHSWPTLKTIAMIDRNPQFLSAARQLSQASGVVSLQRAQFIAGDVSTIRLPTSYELIIASYTLAELSAVAVERVLPALWQACRFMMVLIEPGTPAGFARILSARKLLLGLGATIVAPCPGDQACPIEAPNWCHFAERLPRSRAHMRAKAARVPFEDEKFSYLAVARGAAALQPVQARIVGPPNATKAGIAMELCTEEGIVTRTVLKRDKAAFKAVAKKRWGDAL